MSTKENLNKTMDRMTHMIENLSDEHTIELLNQTAKINAKLAVLNKFESELQEELNILDEKIDEIEGNEKRGKINFPANI